MTPLNEARTSMDGRRWRAVLRRDARFDGAFVYAVRTTGIFCRPSCPSRRPGRQHVRFFESAESARGEGFRDCRRCAPASAASPLASRVRAVCAHIDGRLDDAPKLRELAARFGLSPYHLQRTFKRVLGVTPRVYAQERRLARFRKNVKEGRNVTEAMYESGYGSSRGLYERSSERLGMTPRAYRLGGAGADIRYTIVGSPAGRVLVAATAKGVCRVMLGDAAAGLVAELTREYPAARLTRDDAELRPWARAVVAGDGEGRSARDLPLDIRATAFQRRVWEALRAIPPGTTRTYGQIARAIGKPRAARAVGAACGANPVALVIPCHRVVRGDGDVGGYRWGARRKEILLAKEAGSGKRR